MSKKLSNAPMTFGPRQLQNSADSQLWQMTKMSASEERSYLQAAQQQDAHRPTALKSTTSPASAQATRVLSVTQWLGAMRLCQGLESALPMFLKECSDQRLSQLTGAALSLPTGRPSKPVSTPGSPVVVKTNWISLPKAKMSIK